MGTQARRPVRAIAHGADVMSSRSRIAQAELNNAKRYSPYGATWERTRTRGRKPSDGGVVIYTPVTGYVVKRRLQPELLKTTGPVSGTVIEWQWVSDADQDVQTGDTLTNEADRTVVFKVLTTPDDSSGNLT